MVGMEPLGPFCDLGAPVTDDEGSLVAIGADRADEGAFVTPLIGVDAIRAILEKHSQQAK
jgi:hypothetical protein